MNVVDGGLRLGGVTPQIFYMSDMLSLLTRKLLLILTDE